MRMFQANPFSNNHQVLSSSYMDNPTGYQYVVLPKTYFSPLIFALISACAGEFIKTCLFKIANPSYPTSLSKPSLPFKTVAILCVYYHLCSNTFETNPLIKYINIPTFHSSIIIFVIMLVANYMDIFPSVTNGPGSATKTTSNPTSVTTPSKYKVDKRSLAIERPSFYSTKYD
ncbi:hypothetical protein DFA_00702 [Cavenderia fasciculata]|uniref:Transmembrane protein n=1 Tax=Cavenderia fasciculata TaxID=261658 RepID=F4PTA1_CACFS|nr:uncharacterized protein DFA_00702 [Cavenderia fasciculata]EGG20837.1 hypothetical protein DFA_00702 [Cavenderia fasciculata]|eukprot:XP_004358687.1 hypothetical protein DFA_00702 [Cavenderia fasciculata]